MSEYISAPPRTPMGDLFGGSVTATIEAGKEAQLKKELEQAQKSGWSETAQEGIKSALATLQAYYQGKASKVQAQAALAQKQSLVSQERGGQLRKYLPYIAIGGVGLVAVALLTRKK